MVDDSAEQARGGGLPSLERATAGTASGVVEPASLGAFVGRVVRYRQFIFVFVALVFVASFNGQWRIGRDSAIYRQIGRNLARSHRYVFRDKDQKFGYVVEEHEVVYPGLPVVLAGVELAFGGGALPVLLMMYALAAATVWLTYRLAREHYPRWVAVATVLTLGVNRIFLEQSNDIQTDLPFLFGVMLSLYGWERLRRATDARGWAVVAAGLVAPGLAIAATMRPTFWMLAIAWVGASAWGLIVGDRLADGRRSRAPSAVALGTLVALALLAVALDPRTKGFHPTAGGYERRVAKDVADLRWLVHAVVTDRLPKTMEQHLPQCFFALTLKQKEVAWRVLAWAYSLMLIGSAAWLLRVNRLWGMLALCTIGSLIVIGDVPRYYLMILPLLLMGWLAFCHAVARRTTWFAAMPGLAMLWGIGVVVVPNFVRSLDLVREQRGLDRRLHHRSFVEAYDGGKKLGLVHMAELVRAHATAGQRVIGPEPVILTYMTDRTVYGLNSFLPKRAGTWGDVLAKVKFDLGLFPAGRVAAVYDKDDATPALIADLMVLPGEELGRTEEGTRLCVVKIRASRKRSTKGVRLAEQRAAAAAAATTRATTQP